MSQPVVHIKNLNLQYKNKVVFKDLNWIIKNGENWALTGISGSGKTSLAKAIAGLQNVAGDIKINFSSADNLPAKVLYVESWYKFKNIEGVANFYYQQRYTSWQAKETLTVKGELTNYAKENSLDIEEAIKIAESVGLKELLNSQLIELSSGEHKKMQLVKALWLKPQLLILDQPYTGLDAASRKNLNILLDELIEKGGQLIIICNYHDALPNGINRFAKIENGQLQEINSVAETAETLKKQVRELPDFLKKAPVYSSKQIVKMVNINISYGDKQVLKNINWEVNKGERWLLQGHNGSGKSTLLSLINGDHPQAYANELYLFDQRRGSGESIWDIKERIGLISPEFHWYFDASSTVWQSVASGLYDNFGLKLELPYTKAKQVDDLIAFFGLSEIRNEKMDSLSLGKQRLVLLARTIIKNPELLILDEPCQGLDHSQTVYFNHLVDELCSNGMTLIYVGHYESALPNTLEKKIVLEKGEVKAIENLTLTKEAV